MLQALTARLKTAISSRRAAGDKDGDGSGRGCNAGVMEISYYF
jgi:hypothetical protein